MPVRRRGDEARSLCVVGTVVDIAARLVVRAYSDRPILGRVSVDFTTGAPVAGDLAVSWVHGSPNRRQPTDPAVQVHRYDEHTFVLRQSKDVHFEAPFVFLLFGNDRAILFDTGATDDRSIRTTVDGLVDQWQQTHSQPDYDLVVAHTHGHGDHVAGDPSFADRANTTVVDKSVDSVRDFFGFTDWPAEVVVFDLGGRVLEVMGLPGHQAASIAVYDPWTGLLLTGDSVLPARLYVDDMPAYIDSLNRLVDLADARPVSHVLGCHVEMTRRPARDYFPGCRYQPDEPPLPMTTAQLRAVRDAAVLVAHRSGVHRFDDFIVYNGMGKLTFVRLNARGLFGTLRARLSRRQLT
jgi:hydroxyacylglutathione hydrolase